MTGGARPQVIVLAGPNGAGKSTAAPEVVARHLEVSQFVNADDIARGLAGFAPQTVDLAAGRIMLARLRELASNRQNFAFETTLSSRTFAPWIGGLVEGGYDFHLYYVWVRTPDLAVERVRARFESGGHTVPEVDVRRRYVRSVRNFFTMYKPLATTWRVYDNSASTGPVLIARGGTNIADTIDHGEAWALFCEVSDEASGE
jgi:predicted ABC-type ATPase